MTEGTTSRLDAGLAGPLPSDTAGHSDASWDPAPYEGPSHQTSPWEIVLESQGKKGDIRQMSSIPPYSKSPHRHGTAWYPRIVTQCIHQQCHPRLSEPPLEARQSQTVSPRDVSKRRLLQAWLSPPWTTFRAAEAAPPSTKALASLPNMKWSRRCGEQYGGSSTIKNSTAI